MKQAAVIVVVDPTGHVLLLRRGPTDPWKPGHWNFPGGGVDPKESVTQAAYRELAEESGICLSSGLRFLLSFTNDTHLVHLFLLRVARRPRISFPDSEHDAYVWAKLSEFPSPGIPDLPKTQRFLQDVAPYLFEQARQRDQDKRDFRRRTRMPASWPKNYANWPKYLPFPTAIRRGMRPVPNRSSVTWPQSQFAPLYLPPGSPSFQPYSYLKQDIPLSSMKPHYTSQNKGYLETRAYQTGSGPGGDVAQTPYGALALKNPTFTPIPSSVLQKLPVSTRFKVRSLESKILAAEKQKKHVLFASLLSKHSKIRAQLLSSGYSYGDGMAYELAPLQASPHALHQYGLGGYGDVGALALDNGSCSACQAKNNGTGSATAFLISQGLAAAFLAPTILVGPWLLDQVKPEWSYTKRVAASLVAFTALAGVGIGFDMKRGPSAPAAPPAL